MLRNLEWEDNREKETTAKKDEDEDLWKLLDYII